jgi:drug/metabolite transporter (DMT)-like permease
MTTSTPIRTRLDALAVASLLLCCALWGLNQVAAKVTLAEIPPLLQAAARSLGAAVLVALWSLARGITWLPADRRVAGAGLLAGSLFAGEFACIFIGLQHTLASRMIVFIYLSPFVVALGMRFVGGAERLVAVQWLGLAAAFGGVAWAFGDGFGAAAQARIGGDGRQWLGDSLGVAAALLWGATTLVIRGTRLATAPAEATLQYQLLVSGVVLAMAAAWRGENWPPSLSSTAMLLMAFQIVIVTFASYLLWFWLVRHYPPTRVAAFTLLTPLFGLLGGVVLLGEPLTPKLLIAVIGVSGGIALVNRVGR